MANGFSKFSQDHHYASGIILVTVGLVGVVGSLSGNLANMLAALFVPDILKTGSGAQADSGSLPNAIVAQGSGFTVGPVISAAGGAGPKAVISATQGVLKWLGL